MSIITDALKKVENEKGSKTMSSKAYVNKVMGPERKGTYQGKELKGNKTLIAAGSMVLLTIIILAVSNAFLIPKDLELAGRTELLEAEAYRDMRSEIELLESERVAARKELLSSFRLNGIVWDSNDSWAIINNRIVRPGDVLEGVTIVSIKPQKVVLSFKQEEFDLVVK